MSTQWSNKLIFTSWTPQIQVLACVLGVWGLFVGGLLQHRPSLFSSHLISFCILRVRGAWSSHGAVYPNHISTRANPQDSWGIFTAQLKHELDNSFMVHLCKTPSLSSACHCKPPSPTNTHTHKQGVTTTSFLITTPHTGTNKWS